MCRKRHKRFRMRLLAEFYAKNRLESEKNQIILFCRMSIFKNKILAIISEHFSLFTVHHGNC